MIHPTVLVAFPGLAEALVRVAEPLWQERLGPKALALEVARPDSLDGALVSLLAQPRQLELRRKGYDPDPALTLAVIASGDEAGLPGFVEKLEQKISNGPWAGMELRLHLVLFLREPENLAHFPPNPDHHPPTRVWPVSRWARNGLYLPKEEHLAVWVQHFVEALVASQAPLQPEKGRDWVGLGIARLEMEQPNPQTLVPILWEAIRQVELGVPPEVPPPPPWAFQPTPPPARPERTSCDAHPNWSNPNWDRYRQEQRAAASLAVEQALLPLESPAPYELGRQALLLGLPALPKSLNGLKKAIQRAEDERATLLETLDKTAGVAEKRARLNRLRARIQRGGLGGREDLQQEIRTLQKALEPVDQALEEGNVAFFLQHDPEAQQASRELATLEEWFQNNRERWEKEVDNPPPPSNRPKQWTQWFTNRLRPATPPESGSEMASIRKRLCGNAWHLLQEAHPQQERLTQRHLFFGEVLDRFAMVNRYLEALKREQERAKRALTLAKGFVPSRVHPEDNPLVVRIPQHVPSTHPKVRAAAHYLVKEGALEAFWDNDLKGFENRLWEVARWLAKRLGPVQLSTPDELLWSTLVVAGAPRVLVHNWPEHRQYAYVLGPNPKARWGEAYDQESWLPGEGILFRMVFPLTPEQFLEGTTPLTPESHGEETPPTSPAPRGEEVLIRHNPLLDEIFK